MKKQNPILLICLLLIAALLGWLLPTAVFHGLDRSAEGKPEPVSIRQIDLSYQSDLQIEDRLRLVQEGYHPCTRSPLERGVYQDANQVQSTLEAFLQDLTGYSFQVTEQRRVVQPLLLSFPGDGAFLVWETTVFLNETWSCEAILDDRTGLILCCNFDGATTQWESLFSELGDKADVMAFVYNRLQEALLNHYQTIFSAEYTSDVQLSISDGEACLGDVVLSQDGSEPFRIPFLFVFGESFLKVGSL